MGVDAEDVDGDGLPELFVTNFANEYNTLYQNYGKGMFYDNTAFFGLASDTMPWVNWGCALVDLRQRRLARLLRRQRARRQQPAQLGQPVDYEEIPLLFRNMQRKAVPAGDPRRRAVLRHQARGPGAAFGDIDNDGDIDIVVNHKDRQPPCSATTRQTTNHWIRFVLQGTRSNRDAIGTRVEVDRATRVIFRQRKGGVSMESANDPRLLIGVGAVPVLKKITIRWPSGIVTTRENVKANQEYKVIEPKDGAAAPAHPAAAAPTGNTNQSATKKTADRP